jgi:uridylate kinase
MSTPRYQRILLKLSGEALMGEQGSGIDSRTLRRLAQEVIDLCEAGVEVGLVIGGGNIIRGAQTAGEGLQRVTGDHMGMLATVINALAMQDAIEYLGRPVRVMSAIKINQVCEDYISRRAIRHMQKGRQGRRGLQRRPDARPQRPPLYPPDLRRGAAAASERHGRHGPGALPRP